MAMIDGFCAAAAEGNVKLVKGFISRRVDPNQWSSEGFLPLCLASFWGYSDVVKMLLEYGANINGQNKGTSWTPCHCAAFQGHGKVIMILLEKDPNLDLKDDLNRSCIDFASALDTIWPHFAARGCKRTTKEDLIRLKIVEKVVPRNDSHPIGAESAYFSRPGSAYVVKSQPLYRRGKPLRIQEETNKQADLSDKQYLALNNGDVLTETSVDDKSARSLAPQFSAWRR